MKVNKGSLAQDLRNLGLQTGDTVLGRGAMSKLGVDKSDGNPAAILYDAFRSVVGNAGTICTLAFTPMVPFWKKSEAPLFHRYAPSVNGAFPNYMIGRESALRSRHPSNSWVAEGPHAEHILSGHGPDADPFLPVDVYMELGGKFCAIGCIHSGPGSSTVHRHQERLGIDTATPLTHVFGAKIVGEDGEPRWWSRRQTPGCSMGFGKFYGHYLDAGVMRTGPVGAAFAFMIDAKGAYEVEREIMNSNPRFPLCDDDGCVMCATRFYNLRALPVFIPIFLWRLLTGKQRFSP